MIVKNLAASTDPLMPFRIRRIGPSVIRMTMLRNVCHKQSGAPSSTDMKIDIADKM